MCKADEHICPSSTAQEGAMLLGVVMANQSVALLPQPMPVDAAFLTKAAEDGPLEKRFRFSNRCMQHGCRQWGNGGCGVIDTLAKANALLDVGLNLPTCSIRPQCRWYSQEGAKACAICPYVVTDSMEITAERVFEAVG